MTTAARFEGESDQDLVEAVLAGPSSAAYQDAFAALVERFGGMVNARITHCDWMVRPEDREDIAHELWIKIRKRCLPGYRPEKGPFGPYLGKFVDWVVKDFNRKWRVFMVPLPDHVQAAPVSDLSAAQERFEDILRNQVQDVGHLKIYRAMVHLVPREQIMARCGISRRTFFRRRRDLAGILGEALGIAVEDILPRG